MTKKLHIKIRQKSGRRNVKIRYLVVVLAVIAMTIPRDITKAVSCPDVRVIFARGSGEERNKDRDFLSFRDSIQSKLATTGLSYDVTDLDYPAVDVGIKNIPTAIGALISSGESYEFGRSVSEGSRKLIRMVNSNDCPGTRFVLGGYSQGAMVLSKSLPRMKAEKIIYAATFGDPKIYLPEGAGIFPMACVGQNLSDYRMYVPDCQTYKGMLGGYVPYEPREYVGKMGTWCNKHDFFCSPFLDISKHVSYAADNLYEDASRVIFNKVSRWFHLKKQSATPHDTAILIDSTGSMDIMIEEYKREAYRLAEETLNSGGRIALYDYRDLIEDYEPVEHCNFENCTLEKFMEELDKIKVGGGDDVSESALSASLHVMKKLKWKMGSTKSLIILSDADYLMPDRDGVTLDQVVELSKKIDPVNFYIITNYESSGPYQELASRTDGKVVTNMNELSLLTDYIMDRVDSLPRVEEETPMTLPILTVESVEKTQESKAKVKFNTTGTKTLVIVNDAILGVTNETEIVLNDLNDEVGNNLTLVPMTDEIRGESVEVKLNDGKNLSDEYDDNVWSAMFPSQSLPALQLPKAPDAGKVKFN